MVKAILPHADFSTGVLSAGKVARPHSNFNAPKGSLRLAVLAGAIGLACMSFGAQAHQAPGRVPLVSGFTF